MSDFTPMLAGEPSELEALLLRSAEDDAPALEALEKAGTALGVSAAALAAASATGALAAPAVVAGNVATLAKPLTVASLAKWLAVGIGAGMVTGGAAHVVSRVTTPPPSAIVAHAPRAVQEPTGVTQSQPHSVVAPAVPEQVAVPSPEPVIANAPLPSNTAAFAVTPTAPAAAAPGAPAAPVPSEHTGSASFATEDAPRAAEAETAPSTLGEETKVLDRARHSLAVKRPAEALAAIDGYRVTWPHGALRAEAALLRVEALLRLGNRSAAEREANAIIAQAPGSRYATRAAALLASPAP